MCLIDQTLANQFNVHINHKQYKSRSALIIAFLSIYYGILLMFFPAWAFYMGTFKIVPKLTVYYIQYMVTCGATFAAINSGFMISERYAAIAVAYKELKLGFDQRKSASAIVSEVSDNVFAKKFGVLLTLFKELTELTSLSNEIYGWTYVVCFIRTFSVVLIQKYSIVLLIFSDDIEYSEKFHKAIIITIINMGDASKVFFGAFMVTRLKAKVAIRRQIRRGF